MEADLQPTVTPPSGPDCERFSPEILPGRIGRAEVLHASPHHDLRLITCEECGQLFVCDFVEVWDDSWTFWARVSDEEAALVREEHGRAAALIASRRHVVWPPSWKGDAYWSVGPEPALSTGPRPAEY